MDTITLMGAGGKMGFRAAEKLIHNSDYKLLCVEINDLGLKRLAEIGISVTPQDEALKQADIVILAVPDALIKTISSEIVPKLNSGTMLIGLDPAAAYAGVLPERKDITYFITHPCHPPLFNDETDPAAKQDYFGGVAAKQSIVCALHQGPEENYERGEALARIIFAPVIKAHRVTTEQMAILEPALVETLTATCLTIMREGMDEAIHMGVPEEAARDFLLGHIRGEIAIIFDLAGFPFSDGAKFAIDQAKKRIFKSDWKDIMTINSIKESVRGITKVNDI